MKTTLDEFKAEQAEKLAKFEKEMAWCEHLPEAYRESASICIHSDSTSISLWSGFRTDKKLADAVTALEHFKPCLIDGEHWKDGCCSTSPARINSCAKSKNAVMDGSHAVEILVSGGRGFGPDVEIRFWIDVPSLGLAEISCPVCDLWKMIPRVNVNYNRHGEVSSGEITWPVESQVVDSFRRWSGRSDLPSYRGSYYLADVPNFEAWASNHLPKAETVSA